SALPRPRPDGDFGEDGPPVGGVFAEPAGAQLERARDSAVAASTASVEGLARTAPLLSRGSLNRGTRSNLSAPMDAFFGREEELEDLANRVSGGQRLITVVGSAGTGKTRLAKRFGAQVVGDLGGGTWFCDLCEARGESGILSAVGAALGVRLTGEDPATQLAEAMGRRGRSLVILDNFEHVAEHAVATLGRWLQAAPEAVFLVTSRALLHLTGEEAFYLDPLPTEEAVVVFYDRARAVQPEFERTPENEGVIRDIVERLDGVLLAIELAAARVRLLTPEAIRDRLSQRFKLLRGARRGQAERHATLQSAIDWSWDLLQPEEKSALAQLSVFRGGCTLEAAETIVDLGGFDGTPWVVDVVESLVDQSLVRRLEPQPGHVRYQMLESIREYAAEKLGDDGSAATRRCVDHFAALGHEDFLDSLHTHGGLDRLRGLSLELENLVAAAEEGLSLGDPNQGAACALAAAVLFTRNGPVSDGLALLHRFSTERLDPVVRANLCRRKGGLLRLAGRDSAAEENHQRALSTYRDLGDHRGEAI
ncbi:MAG TPA: hypothetical protein DIU15_15600, partial [Deltaproteobacteria bacterium]|nr:hypothetical protein [Deltaproteobacteria bacterium]